MIKFQFPEGADGYQAAAFNQDGTWIMSGAREACEIAAQEAGGLYCGWNNGRPFIKHDFERDE